jgi:hypothetical protein
MDMINQLLPKEQLVQIQKHSIKILLKETVLIGVIYTKKNFSDVLIMQMEIRINVKDFGKL